MAAYCRVYVLPIISARFRFLLDGGHVAVYVVSANCELISQMSSAAVAVAPLGRNVYKLLQY